MQFLLEASALKVKTVVPQKYLPLCKAIKITIIPNM
jgi:hypothetical protein